MDPFSAAAGAVGFVDAAARLVEGCSKLYEFWKTLQEAPGDFRRIKEDYDSVTGVLGLLSGVDLDPAIVRILESCQSKIKDLEEIFGLFDVDKPKRPGLREKYRMTSKIKQSAKIQKVFKEIRGNLLLGMVVHNARQLSPNRTGQGMQAFLAHAAASTNTADAESQLNNAIFTTTVGYPTEPPLDGEATSLPKDPPSYESISSGNKETSMAAIAANPLVNQFLKQTMHLAVDELFASGTVTQLMQSTMDKVNSFETAYSGSYNSEGYEVRKSADPTDGEESQPVRPSSVPQAQGSPGRRPRLVRSRVCHQKSSIGVVLGSVWIRTSTLKVSEEASVTAGQLEVVTSFVFYPASWLTRFGMRYGAEANLQWTATAGWNINISAVRAVPDSALIFDMCKRGNVDGIQLLLQRGEASLKDTSPKGWTPLHFAASKGHVGLCEALIQAGAEKQALAYEGPTPDALSPLAIWSESCHDMSAAKKIDMMRVFGTECLDVSELNSDGWVVGYNLIASMSKEKCSMAETSVNYLFSQKQTEILVALGARSVWHGLQQAIRGFLIEEYDRGVVGTLLHRGEAPQSRSRTRAMGHWLAIRASQRDLVPLAIQAARLLQVDGYEPIPGMEGMGKRDLNRALPTIYTTWAKMSSRVLSNVKKAVEDELRDVLKVLSMDLDAFAKGIEEAAEESAEEIGASTDSLPLKARCDDCRDDYTPFGKGLVQPRRVAFDECRETEHKYHCTCADYLRARGISQVQPVAASGDADDDVEEEFFQQEEDDVDLLCDEYDRLSIDESPEGDPFYDAARMLYCAHGRQWIGSYDANESLCASCFLEREEYIGKEGPAGGKGFTPMPKSYVSVCPDDILNANYYT